MTLTPRMHYRLQVMPETHIILATIRDGSAMVSDPFTYAAALGGINSDPYHPVTEVTTQALVDGAALVVTGQDVCDALAESFQGLSGDGPDRLGRGTMNASLLCAPAFWGYIDLDQMARRFYQCNGLADLATQAGVPNDGRFHVAMLADHGVARRRVGASGTLTCPGTLGVDGFGMPNMNLDNQDSLDSLVFSLVASDPIVGEVCELGANASLPHLGWDSASTSARVYAVAEPLMLAAKMVAGLDPIARQDAMVVTGTGAGIEMDQVLVEPDQTLYVVVADRFGVAQLSHVCAASDSGRIVANVTSDGDGDSELVKALRARGGYLVKRHELRANTVSTFGAKRWGDEKAAVDSFEPTRKIEAPMVVAVAGALTV